MKREVKSFWFPTWLAQAAVMVPGSRIIDAPPHNLSFKDIEADVKAHDLIVIHTSTPSFKSDCRTAGMIRAINPTAKIGFIGAKVAVEPNQSLEACPALDFVCRNEYEFTIQELARGDVGVAVVMAQTLKIAQIMQLPDVKEVLDSAEMERFVLGPEPFGAQMAADSEKFTVTVSFGSIALFAGVKLSLPATRLTPAGTTVRKSSSLIVMVTFDEVPTLISPTGLTRRRSNDRVPRSNWSLMIETVNDFRISPGLKKMFVLGTPVQYWYWALLP